MLRKLKRLLRGRKRNRIENQVEELRIAIAGLLADRKDGDASDNDSNRYAEAVLLHAAEARANAEDLQAAYGALAMRVAELERKFEADGSEHQAR